MRKEMHQPKPKGSQSGRSIDDDELMVAGGRHKEDPPAVPRPQELREGMQVTQIRGSLREKVFNYVTSTDAGRAGLSDKVRILGQTVRYQRDLEELQELLDYKAFPIPLFDEKSPTYTNTKTRVWGDGLEDSPINRPLIAFQVAKSKFHGYSRLIAEINERYILHSVYEEDDRLMSSSLIEM
ncbi:hypothetical protein AAMO2058_001238600 [Amorphochlora amoebiformis]